MPPAGFDRRTLREQRGGVTQRSGDARDDGGKPGQAHGRRLEEVRGEGKLTWDRSPSIGYWDTLQIRAVIDRRKSARHRYTIGPRVALAAARQR